MEGSRAHVLTGGCDAVRRRQEECALERRLQETTASRYDEWSYQRAFWSAVDAHYYVECLCQKLIVVYLGADGCFSFGNYNRHRSACGAIDEIYSTSPAETHRGNQV